MKSLLPLLTLLVCTLTSFGQFGEQRLWVDLVPESTTIAPGKPFVVAVKMKHIEHGHSYWKNPGGPGQGTTISWTMPEGFSAAEPQWPAPQKGIAATFASYLYEGEIAPLVTITPPATIKPGATVALEAFVKGIVCVNTCLPARVKASVNLNVSDTVVQDPASQALFAKARAALPVSPKGWEFIASKKDGNFVISLSPGQGAAKKLGKVYFFSAAYPDQVTDVEKEQTVAQDGDHWTLIVPPANKMLDPTTTLAGLLVSDDGWLEGDANTRAFEVSLTIGAAAKGSSASASSSGATTGGRSTATLLLFAFIGGLILNVMPCVFPVIGIKIMGFVRQAGEDRKKIVLHGLAYTFGVLLCFWALALFVILTGRGWGTQLQSPLFVLGLCYFFMAFGLNMAGVFEIGTSAIGVGQELQNKSGLQGSFFSGLLATVVATPCSAPFLGPALAYAVSLPPVLALLVFTVIGLGLSSPYLVMSIAPGLVKVLPRPGAWMESFKQGMSFLLFATAGYMLYTLGGLIDEIHLLLTIFGLVLIAMACWIYGRWCLPHKSARARSLGMAFTLAALAGGLYLGWPTARDAKWQVWSPELVKQLRDEKKPVYIDFTARWCATCQVNKLVYHDKKLKQLIADKKIELLKADWTDYDDRITKVLRDEYHKAAVPVNVLYTPGATEPIILPELLSVSNVSEAFEKIGAK